MALIDRTGFIEDAWRWQEDGVTATSAARAIVPLARYRESLETGGPRASGVAVPNDTPSSAIAPYVRKLELVAIDFPSAADGRGFSLARELRALGFTGELRARGPLIADQFPFAVACGFDTVEIPASLAARQPQAQWRRALAFIDHVYQSGYRPGYSILEARHAGVEPRAGRWLELGGEPPGNRSGDDGLHHERAA